MRKQKQARGPIFSALGLERTRRELGAKIARAIDDLGPIFEDCLPADDRRAFWRGVDAEMNGEDLDTEAAAVVKWLRQTPAIDHLVLHASSYHLCSSALARKERVDNGTTKSDEIRQ